MKITETFSSLLLFLFSHIIYCEDYKVILFFTISFISSHFSFFTFLLKPTDLDCDLEAEVVVLVVVVVVVADAFVVVTVVVVATASVVAVVVVVVLVGGFWNRIFKISSLFNPSLSLLLFCCPESQDSDAELFESVGQKINI